MARTLKINVQVDRLPDIKVTKDQTEKAWCQLGLRLSAAIEPSKPPDADPTLRTDADLLQPSLWRAKQDEGNGTWKVHAKENWTLWRWKKGVATPQMIPTKDWKIVVTDPAAFDPPVATVRRFHQRISDAVAEILVEGGTRALEAPGADGVVAGRTVFGLTESLTGLPHPVPAGMQVWTAVSIDSAAVTIADTDRFLAAPSFVSPGNIAYQVKGAENPPPAPAADVPWEVPYAPDDSSPLAVASVHASLPMKALQILGTDEQKLIDLSTLLIRKGGSEFESSDWSTGLPLRIAEAIDPAARAMAVLDNVIRTLVAKEEKEAKALRSATRDALQADILPAGQVPAPDYLRRALAALHRPVLAPRSRSSRPTAAPAASLLERLAIGNSSLWPAVVPILFAHAGAEDAKCAPSLPWHVVTTRARLADAAGILPGRNDALVDATKPTDEAVPRSERIDNEPLATIDNEQAFRDWLLHHWTSAPDTAVAEDGAYRFQGTAKRFFHNGNQVKPEIRRTGVIDLMRLPDEHGMAIEIPIALKKLEVAFPVAIVFTLGVPNAPASSPTFEFKLSLHQNKTELSVDGEGTDSEPLEFTGGLLTIKLSILKDGAIERSMSISNTRTQK